MLRKSQRCGFTLIELLVVMGIIAFLAAIVMMAAPSILDKDRARDAASQIQGALQNARMRAMRDGMPRGVRFLIDPDSQSTAPSRPTASNTNSNQASQNIFFKSSAYQYIEVPPWLLFSNQSGATPANPKSILPYLQVSLTPNAKQATLTDTTTTPPTNYTYPAGAIGTAANSRTCTIGGLTNSQLIQLEAIVNGPPAPSTPVTLGLPTLGVWTQILPGSLIKSKTTAGTCTVSLSVYPDTQLGAATSWAVHTGFSGPAYFGIYQNPRPLLGEPIAQLPINTTIDLSDGASQPSYASVIEGIASSTGTNFNTVASNMAGYDVLFSPSGQMMSPFGVGQVDLWVRDPSKGISTPGLALGSNGEPYCSICPSASTFGSPAIRHWSQVYATGNTPGQPWNTALNAGGEQLLITIKASAGGTGVAPIFWTGTVNQTPYDLSRIGANVP